MPKTSGIIADWLILTKLPNVKKLGLIAVIRMQRRKRTIRGAQEAKRQRLAREGCGMVADSVAIVLKVLSLADRNNYPRLIESCAGTASIGVL
jgi:hypothetical protein